MTSEINSPLFSYLFTFTYCIPVASFVSEEFLLSFEAHQGFQDKTGLAVNALCPPRHTAHHTINLNTNFSFLLGDNCFGAAVLVQLVTAARYLKLDEISFEFPKLQVPHWPLVHCRKF